MAKKVFISQLMKDLTPEQITPVRESAIEYIKNEVFPDEEVVIVDSYFGADYDPNKEMEGIENIPLFYLGKSFQLLATADFVAFVGDPLEGRGTRLEYEAAKAYGIEHRII